MKKISAVSVLAVSILISASALAAGWEMDKAHSDVSFVVKHLMVTNVRGEFRDFKVDLKADEKDVMKSTVEASIDVSSIDTREPKRDGHLKSPDFFDAAKFPTITFKSKSIAKTKDGTYKLKGDLTLHGVTKEVVLDMEHAGVTATGTLNRMDYGVSWNKALDNGGVLVGNDVKILIELEFMKKPEAAAK